MLEFWSDYMSLKSARITWERSLDQFRVSLSARARVCVRRVLGDQPSGLLRSFSAKLTTIGIYEQLFAFHLKLFRIAVSALSITSISPAIFPLKRSHRSIAQFGAFLMIARRAVRRTRINHFLLFWWFNHWNWKQKLLMAFFCVLRRLIAFGGQLLANICRTERKEWNRVAWILVKEHRT